MTTPPGSTAPDPRPDDDQPGSTSGSPGAEIGVSDGEGSTFEPEEDPDGHG